jgi:hypothetical protein
MSELLSLNGITVIVTEIILVTWTAASSNRIASIFIRETANTAVIINIWENLNIPCG